MWRNSDPILGVLTTMDGARMCQSIRRMLRIHMYSWTGVLLALGVLILSLTLLWGISRNAGAAVSGRWFVFAGILASTVACPIGELIGRSFAERALHGSEEHALAQAFVFALRLHDVGSIDVLRESRPDFVVAWLKVLTSSVDQGI